MSEALLAPILESLRGIQEQNGDIAAELSAMHAKLTSLQESHDAHCEEDRKRFEALEKSSAETTQERRTNEAVRTAQALVVAEQKADAVRAQTARVALRQALIVAICAVIFGALATIAFSHIYIK